MNEIRFSQQNKSPEIQTGPKDSLSQKENVPTKKRGFWVMLKKIFFTLFFILVILLIIFFARDITGKLLTKEPNNYSAVFLSNNQVYFGIMIKNSKDELVLKNVFYVQANESNDGAGTPIQSINQPRFNLVKLGNEIHGPTDSMHINKSHIMFYEDLREDSVVVQAIRNYKE